MASASQLPSVSDVMREMREKKAETANLGDLQPWWRFQRVASIESAIWPGAIGTGGADVLNHIANSHIYCGAGNLRRGL